MQTQSYDMEILAQANEVLTSLNTAVMPQLALMNVTMNAIQAQLNTLTLAPMNQSSSNRNYYFCSYMSNFTHWSTTLSSKNLSIKIMQTIIRDWGEARKGANED